MDKEKLQELKNFSDKLAAYFDELAGWFSGCDQYIQKPRDLDYLGDAVNDVCSLIDEVCEAASSEDTAETEDVK